MSTQFLIDLCHHGDETQILEHFEPSDFNRFFFIETCRANRSIDIIYLFIARNKDLLCPEILLYLFKSSHKQVFRSLLDIVEDDKEMLRSIVLIILYNGSKDDLPLLEYIQNRHNIWEMLSFRSIQPHTVGSFRHWLLEHINPIHKFLIIALLGFDFQQNKDEILRLMDEGVRPHCLLDVLLEIGDEDNFTFVMEYCADYRPPLYLLLMAVKSPCKNIFQFLMGKITDLDNQLLTQLLDECLDEEIKEQQLHNAVWMISNYFDTFLYEDLITIVISSNCLAIVEALVEMDREHFCQHIECGNIEDADILRYVIEVLGDAFIMTDELMLTFISNNVEDAVPDYVLSSADVIIDNAEIFVDKEVRSMETFHEKNPNVLEKIKQEGFYWACASSDIEQMRWWYSTFKDIVLDQDVFKVLCKSDFVEGVQFFIAETNTSDLYMMDTGFIAAGKKGSMKVLDFFVSLYEDRYCYKIIDAILSSEDMKPKVQITIAVFNETQIVSRTEGTCSICLDDQPNVITACDHMFCRECLTDWFRKSKKMMCPYCRGCVEQCCQLKLI
jgi:hypothetical protein